MKLRFRPTYANVVATLALFMALGGVSYAAATLPKGSVGTDQLQPEAVRTGKLAGGAVTHSKLSQGVQERLAATATVATPPAAAPQTVKYAETAGRATAADKADVAKEAETAAQADSADEATTAAHADDADELGGRPANSYMTVDSVLPSGETLVGDFAAAAASGGHGTALVQFWPHLPETLQGNHIKVIHSSADYTAECPGPTQAAPTYMCIYVEWNYHMAFESFVSTLPGSNYAGPISGAMYWSSANNQGNIRGNWAYTAP